MSTNYHFFTLLVIISIIKSHLGTDESSLPIQPIIDDLKDVIADSRILHKTINRAKAVWKKRILSCGNLIGVSISCENMNWDLVEFAIQEAPKSTAGSTVFSSIKSNSSKLKTVFSEVDKKAYQETFNSMFKNHKNKFWILESTEKLAAENNSHPKSVEEKLFEFGMKCQFIHPCHSFILDLDDTNWHDVFDEHELEEIASAGSPLIRPTDKDLTKVLHDIKDMNTKQIYNYAHHIEHDPTVDHFKTWMSLTLTTTSSIFLCENSGIGKNGESDVMYERWSLVNSIFRGSTIKAEGKEMVSNANSKGRNAKRKLSAITEVERAKFGNRMDVIYRSGITEYGCLEIGHKNNITKEMWDAEIKLPIVMKDILVSLTNVAVDLLHELHTTGYNISGEKIQLLDMDCPYGFIARVRRTSKISYPSTPADYPARISSILRLAVNCKSIIEDTQKKFDNYETALEQPKTAAYLPPFFYRENTDIESSSSSSSNTEKDIKSHRLNNNNLINIIVAILLPNTNTNTYA